MAVQRDAASAGVQAPEGYAGADWRGWSAAVKAAKQGIIPPDEDGTATLVTAGGILTVLQVGGWAGWGGPRAGWRGSGVLPAKASQQTLKCVPSRLGRAVCRRARCCS